VEFICSYCNKVLQTKSALTNHLRSCSLNPEHEKLKAELRLKKELIYINHGDYVCECGRIFSKKTSLDIHKRYCELNPKSEYNKKSKFRMS